MDFNLSFCWGQVSGELCHSQISYLHFKYFSIQLLVLFIHFLPFALIYFYFSLISHFFKCSFIEVDNPDSVILFNYLAISIFIAFFLLIGCCYGFSLYFNIINFNLEIHFKENADIIMEFNSCFIGKITL
jgi:hypothetical protein